MHYAIGLADKEGKVTTTHKRADNLLRRQYNPRHAPRATRHALLETIGFIACLVGTLAAQAMPVTRRQSQSKSVAQLKKCATR